MFNCQLFRILLKLFLKISLMLIGEWEKACFKAKTVFECNVCRISQFSSNVTLHSFINTKTIPQQEVPSEREQSVGANAPKLSVNDQMPIDTSKSRTTEKRILFKRHLILQLKAKNDQY